MCRIATLVGASTFVQIHKPYTMKFSVDKLLMAIGIASIMTCCVVKKNPKTSSVENKKTSR